MNLLKMTLLNNSIEHIENNFCRRTISLFLFAGICAGTFMSVTMPAYAQEEVPEASETMPISSEDETLPVSAEPHDTSTPYVFTKPVEVNAHKRYNQKQFDALLKRVKPYYNQMKNDREKDSFDKEFIEFYEKAKDEKVTDENGRLLENYIHAYDLGAPYTKEDIQNDINEARSYQRHSLFVSFFNNKEHKELQKVVESVNREMTKERMNRNDREEKHRAITQQLEKTKKADEKVTNKMKYVVPAVFAVGAVLAVTVYLCRKRKLGLGKKVLLGVMLGGTLVGFLCTDIRADQHGTLAWNSDYTQYQATNRYDWGAVDGFKDVKTYETFNMTQESIADNGDITYGIWMGYWANVNGFRSWKKPVNVKIGDTNIVIQPAGKPFNQAIQWMKGSTITLKAGHTYSVHVSIYNVEDSGFYDGTITVPKKIESDMVYHGNGGTYDNGKTELRETVKNGTAYKTKENFFTRLGYKFKGWTEIDADGNKIDWTSWINKPWTWTYLHDAHLYAQWEGLEYHVNYDANGGTGSMKTDTIKCGQPFMTSKNTFTRSRYKFVGWNEKADGTGVWWNIPGYQNGKYIGTNVSNGKGSDGVYENLTKNKWPYSYNHDITLYAQWEQTVVEITYDTNGGRINNVKDNNGYAIIENGVYGFQSVQNPNMFVQPIYSSQAQSQYHLYTNSPNAKFYIERYKDTPYYIIQNVNKGSYFSGSGNGQITNANPGQYPRDYPGLCKRDGGAFMYGSNLYDNEPATDQLYYFKRNSNGTYTIFCKRSNAALDCVSGGSSQGTKIQFYTPNGSAAQQFNLLAVKKSEYLNRTKNNSTSLYVSTSIPVRAGYTFKIWNTNASGTGTNYRPGDSISGIKSDLNLHAIWTPNQYQQTVRVRFENADGSFTGYSQAYQANHAKDSLFEWEFPASQQYQSAKVSYKVTGAKSTDVTVYRKKYTVKALARYQNKDGTWPSEYKEEYNKTYRYGEECPDYPKFVNTATDYNGRVEWEAFTVTEDKIMKFDLALDKGSVTVKVYLNGVRKELDNDYFKFDYYVENKLIASQVNSVEDKKSFYKSNFTIKNITPIPGYHYDNKYEQKTWTYIPPFEDNTGIINGVLNKDEGNKYILYISANQYTVNYNPNKGSGSMSQDTVTYNTAYKTKKNAFTRTGYTFNGWNEKADGTGTAWSLSSSGVYEANKTWTWTYTHDITLYAQWKPNNYTYNIKYVSSSGKDLGHDTVTGAFDTSKTVTPPAKTGYTTPAAQTVTFDSTTAKTITFIYPLINYTINYDVNGGNALSSPRTSYNVESSAYTLPVTSRTGYTFTGWTGSNGTTPQKSVTIAAGSTGNKSYKANWSVNSYTNSISHWAGGFKNKEGNNSSKTWFALKTTTFNKNYGETFSMNDSLATAIPNGFYLMGRFGTSSLEGTWKTYEKPYSITQPAKELNFEYDYYPYDYSITYNLNGGTNNSANPSKYNVLYGVSLRNPTKTGYKFLGWYEGNKKVTGINEGADATFSSSNDLYTKLSTRKTGNVTLTAKWKANSLTIHYHSNGAFGGNKYENGSWQNNVILDYEQSKDTIVLTERNEEGTFNSGLQTHGLYDYSWKRKNDIYMYKNGYIGTGKYNTNPNGSGIEIDEDKTFNSVIELANYLRKSIDSKDNSIDLYPQWKAISYSIAYNGNGATSGSMSEQTSTFDRNVELASNNFSRKYTVTYNAMGGTVNAPNNVASATFNGWEDRGNISFIDKNYSYNEFDAPYYSQNYTDLNAAFGFNKYDLIKHYFLYGKSEGRNTKDKAGNAGLYPNKATVKNLTTTNGYKVNLYASWKLGSVTLPTPTRFGYKFLGWYTSAEGGTKISGTTYTPTSNVTLYAHWKLDSYYIDYNVNDAGLTDHITDNLPDNNGSLPGKDTAAMLTDFALQKGSKYNTKYTFKEWNTKPDGSGKKFTTSITNDGSLCKPGETLTLYAIWDTTPIMSAKDFYLIEEVPAPNDVVYSGVGFDKTPTEKYPDKLSEVAYPIKGYTKNGTDISSRIKVEYVEFDGSKTAVSSIDTNKPGKYTVHYSLTDGKQTKKFTRTVTVLPISAPAINAGDKYFKVNTLITADMLKENVSVNDKYDGNLIDKVIIENIENIQSDKDGAYQITYKVTNRANKTTTKTVNIFIIDYLPDNRADEANKFRFVRKDCSEANDYCLQYFDEDSKWANDETLRELLMDSLSKSENETAIKKFKLSSKNSSSKNKN